MQSATLTWKGDASGIYEISYKKQGDNYWITPDSSPLKGLTVTINGLSDDTSYVFKVRDYCPSGPPSPWLYYTFKTGVVSCVAPVGLITSHITETTADLSWTAAASAIGGYFVEYKIDGVNTWMTSAPITSGTHYTLTGLTAGSGYQWRVKSVCASGAQSTSSALSFITNAVTTQCAAIAAGSVVITAGAGNYNATYTNTGGVPSTHVLEFSVDNGTSWGPVLSIFNQTTLSATYGLPGTIGIFPVNHKLRVTPKCADGSLGAGATGTFTSTQFIQYVTFQNLLDAGSISGIRIDGNPNILNSPITVNNSRNWNQDGLLGNSHSINGYFSGVTNGVTIKASHVRSGSVLWSGTAIYNGAGVPLLNGRILADKDIIKVERQSMVNISGTLKLGINDYADHCHSQGMGFLKLSLNASYPQPISIQIAYVTTMPGVNSNFGAGGDLVPADDPYKAFMQSATYYPAQITIPANTAIYNTSSSQVYSGSSLVFLRKDGQVLNFDPTVDGVGEHGTTISMFPDCNPSFGKMLIRIYYKVISPIGLVNLNLTAVSDDVSASRITLVKL